MPTNSVSRRNVLKSLSIGAVAGSVLRTIPLAAAEYAHSVIEAEKTDNASGYAPKFFGPHEYKTLQLLCETILPADADSGGAILAIPVKNIAVQKNPAAMRLNRIVAHVQPGLAGRKFHRRES